MITIRRAGTADAALIAQMSRQTFYDAFAADNSKEDMDKFMEEQFSVELLMSEVGAPQNIFLLALEDDEPVGYARLRENNIPPELNTNRAMEIARIYTVKPAIGKGIGTELMKEALRIATELNYSTVWLGVWEHNLLAQKFYRRWGFEKFGTHPFVLGNDVQTDWLMKREG